MILSDRLQPTNKHNPCPVCEKTNGNCRIQTNGGVQCMTFPDGYGMENHPVYRYVKPTKNGLWGIYYLRTDNDFDRENWEREKAERERERDRIQKSRSESALSVEVRDSEIRKIIEDLKNNHPDRKAEILKKKSFSVEMIAASDLVYVEKYQKLSIEVNPGLAGVNEWGNGLTNNVSGILCFTKNELGQYTGWQIRDEDPNADHRYKWASSGSEKNKKSSHLKNGELPLSVIDNGDRSGIVVLTEGIRLKPDLASNRLNICSIGSAGGLHYNSQRQLKRALKALGASIVWLSPDAGMLTNKGVIDKYWKTIKLVESWGYTVQVLWWQQFNKTDGDIDEINQEKIDSIQYLTPDKFFDVVNLEQWKFQKKTEYQTLKSFTPLEIVTLPYISNLTPPNLDGKILFINSPLGTGKTRLILNILDAYYRLNGSFLLGSRNGLLLQTCAKSDGKITHINFDKQEFNDNDNTAWFASCVDSILKVNKDWWKGKIIIIDEVQSVLFHLLFSSTLNGKGYEVIERFIYAITVAKGVLCLDGHLSDIVVNFFKGICINKVVHTIKNNFVVERPKINFLEGSIENQKIKKNDKSPWLKNLKDTIRLAPVSMASDSRIFLKSMAQIMNELGHKGLLITSETVGSKEVKAFLENPSKWILENEPRYIFYSPTAESGLDISSTENSFIDGYFKSFYSFFFGVVGMDTQRQMLMRLRDITCPRYVWLRSHSIVTDSNFERNFSKAEILSYLISESNDLGLDNNAEILDNLKIKIDSYHQSIIQLSNDFRKIVEHERIMFRQCFLDAVSHDGYELEKFTLEPDIASKQKYKAVSNQVKDQECVEIFNASDKYLNVIAPLLPDNASLEDRRAFEKASILRMLPGVELDAIWSREFIRFIRFDRFGVLSQRRRYFMANNLDIAKRLGNKRYASYIHQAGFCPWELKFEYSQARAIAASGILDLISDSPNEALTADHPSIKKIIQNCKKSSVYKPLGRSPGKDAIKFVSWLLGLLGYRLKSHSVNLNGTTARRYFLDVNDMEKTSDYFRVIDRLTASRLEASVLRFESCENPENIPKIDALSFGVSDSPLSLATNTFEVVTDHADIFIKSKGEVQPSQMKVEVAEVVQKNTQNETQNQASGVKNQPTTGAVITLKMLKSLQIGDRQFTIWNDDLNEWESSEITAICPNSILFTTSKGFPLWISENNLNHLVLDEFEGMRA